MVCPYHGWAFDGEGVLQDVPAAETQKEWPRKQLIQSYPCQGEGNDLPAEMPVWLSCRGRVSLKSVHSLQPLGIYEI